MIAVGMDIGKYKIDVFYAGTHHVIGNNAKAVGRFVKSLPQNSRVVMEATGKYHRLCHEILHVQGIEVMVINPFQSRNFAKSVNVICKTDKTDALILASYCERMEFRPTPVPTQAERGMQELFNHLEDLKAQRTALNNRTDGAEGFVLKSLKSALKAIAREIEKTEAELERVVADNEEIKEKCGLLETIPGIGRGTALMLMSRVRELGSLNKNRIAALTGLAPRNNDSGTVRGRRYVYGGRADVRAKLYLPVLGAATRHNPALKVFYDRLLKNGKQKKVALTACMRKMIIWANAVLEKKQAWDPARCA